MNKNNVAVGVLVAVGVVAIGASIVWKKDQPVPTVEVPPAADTAMEAAAPSPAPAESEVAEKLAALEEEKLELEKTLANARRELTTLMNDAEAVEEVQDTEKPPNFMDALSSMMDSPELQDMIKVQQRMALDQTHGELFKGLNLDASQLDELKSLIVEKQMVGMNAGLAMMGKKDKAPGPQEDTANRIKAVDEKIAALLGEEGYDQFTQFEDTQMERMQVDLFKERLSGDMALDWEQQHELILALADARQSIEGGDALMKEMSTAPDPARMREAMGYMDEVYEKYIEGAGSVLNAEQLEVFEQSVAQWKVMQEAGLKMAESMFGGALPGSDSE